MAVMTTLFQASLFLLLFKCAQFNVRKLDFQTTLELNLELLCPLPVFNHCDYLLFVHSLVDELNSSLCVNRCFVGRLPGIAVEL
jgi:hypothetical protein